jgi:hypothetical protein
MDHRRDARALVLGLLLGAIAAPALACSAPAPAGAFSGPVLAVPSAGVVCVALGPVPSQWVRVTLSDGSGLDRRRLMATAFAKRVVCDAHAGQCRLDGRDLAALASAPNAGVLATAWK